MCIVYIVYSHDDLCKNKEYRSFSEREKEGKASQCKSLALKTGKVETMVTSCLTGSSAAVEWFWCFLWMDE